MAEFLKSLSPRTRILLALILGGTVIVLFWITLLGFLSARRNMARVNQYNIAIGLARQTDADFQLAISKGKNFAILKDEKNKARTLDYFKKAQATFGELNRVERDPQGQEMLYRLGAGLRNVEFPLRILASTAKKSDPAEMLYARYLKDITIDFDNASQAYVDYLGNKIKSTEEAVASETKMDLLFALIGAFLGLTGMGLSYSIARGLNQALQKETGLEERFRRFAEVAKEGILIHEGGVIRDVNQALLEMTGFSSREMIGNDSTAFLTPESTALVGKFRREGYPAAPYEVTIRRKDGSLLPAEAHGRDFLFGGKNLRVVRMWDITDRKKADEEMKNSEEKFRSLIENSHDIISITDKNAVVSYISHSVKRILGYEPHEITGQRFAPIMHPDDIGRMRATFAEFLNTKGATVTAYFRLRHKDGSWRDIESVGTNLLESPPVNAIIYNMRDITEKKHAEEALRKSEERFRAMLENSNEGITLAAKDGTALYVSPSNKKLSGYDPEERLGRSMLEMVHPDDLPKAKAILGELGKNPGKTMTAQLRLRNKGGEWLIGEVAVTNLLQNPDVGGILVNFRDITARVGVEEALRHSEEKFRGLIDNSHDVISISGRDRAMTYISPSVTRVLGYEPAEMIGRGYAEIMHPDDLERIKSEFARLLGSPGLSWTVQFRLKHKDGSWRHVESTGTNLLENPAVQGIVYNLRDVTERVEAQTALEHRERYFRSLIDKLYDVLMVMDKEGAVTYISPSVERVLGYDPESLAGVKMIELMHPDDAHRPGRIPAAQAAQMPGVVASDRARLRHKDGSWRTVDYTGMSLVNDPAVKGIVTIFRDVTEQEKAENALKQSEENFRSLIEKSPDAILVHRNGIIIYGNPKLLALSGYEEPEELLGENPMSLVHPDDQKIISQRIQLLSQGGRTSPIEVRLVRKDGAVLPVDTASITIQFEGAPAIMVSLRDITARKQAEAVIRETQERYRSLVESMPDAVMVHDEENILYVNPSAVRTFGARNEEEFIGKPFWMVVPAEFRDPVRARVRAIMERGAVNELAERKLKRLDGDLIDVLVTSVPFYDRGRRVVLAIFLDITALKEAERKAQKYQRLAALGEMAAGMAHEIRNPTAAISAQAQYLLKKLEGNGMAYEQLKDIIQQCDRLETLVHDTLDYSPEKKFEERTEIPAKDLLQKSLWLAQTQFGPSHGRVQVILDVSPDLPPLRIHPTRMERVLVNLILNAFQAMPEGGHLLLEAKRHENKAVFRVQDDGKGITEQEMQRLFEPFYTSRKMGSGLGLAICQKIVEEHQGKIQVERVEPHGAAFTIEIPLEQTKKVL